MLGASQIIKEEFDEMNRGATDRQSDSQISSKLAGLFADDPFGSRMSKVGFNDPFFAAGGDTFNPF